MVGQFSTLGIDEARGDDEAGGIVHHCCEIVDPDNPHRVIA